MKQYIKNGEVAYAKDIVLKITDEEGRRMQVFNPTHEMLIADGWEVYDPPIIEPTIEDYRIDKIREIERYDSSTEVNGFYIENYEIWLDKATRVGLKLRFDAEIASGRTNTTLWYDGIPFNLELTTAVQMFNAIELYASACYDNTQMHIANVRALEDIESLKDYDYRIGYPEKLRF